MIMIDYEYDFYVNSGLSLNRFELAPVLGAGVHENKAILKLNID